MNGLLSYVRISLAVGIIVLLALVIAPLGSTTPVSANHLTETKYPTAVGSPNPFENPSRAFAGEGHCNNNNCAGVLQGQTGEYKDFDFDATILSTDTILGIEVTAGALLTTGDQAKLRLLDAGEEPVGDQKSLTPIGSYAEQTVGGAADLWGVAWTADAVMDPDFGVEVSDSGGTGGGFLLDYVSITIHYSDDDDDDGVPNESDNCRYVANPNQENTDQLLDAGGAKIGLPSGGVIPDLIGDGLGDACDSDDDNDLYSDDIENTIGTNPLDNCYGDGDPFYKPAGMDMITARDAWPPDLNQDKRVILTQNVDASDVDFIQGNSMNAPADTPLRKRLNAYSAFNPAVTVADGGDGLTAAQTTVGYQATGDPIITGFVISIDSEMMKVTAVDTVNNVLTVTRGYSRTTATTHAEGATIKDAQFWLNDITGLWSGKGNWECN